MTVDRTTRPLDQRPTYAAPQPATQAGARPGARPGREARIAGLDGVRAFAVAAVLAFHLHPDSLPGGFLGVDVFFVVSGFLITTLLLREIRATGRVHLGAFWTRRARRLLPALVVVVLVGVSAARLIGGDLVVDIDRQVAGALTFSTNWREIAAGSSYFTDTAPLLLVTFWSLAVEEQFYLVWPVALVVLLATVRSRRRRVAVPLVLAVASAVAMAVLMVPGEDPTRVYYGTDTHAFGLMIGVCLALAFAAGGVGSPWSSPGRLRWRTPAGIAGLGVLVVLALTLHEGSTFTYRGGLLLASLATAVVIAALLGGRSALVAALEWRPLVWVGRRSYGIYLWHWPVVLVVAAVLPTAAPDSAAAWLGRGVALALTLALAAASFRLVEEPVRRLGFRESARRIQAALAVPWRVARGPRLVAGLAVVLVATTAVAVATAPDQSATERAIEAGEAALAADGAAVAAEALGADFSAPAGEDITAFGDSIMVTSLGGLNTRFPGIDIR
ncbi:MAG TPA: acyltransferase, partial [Actinotalea sp.]|nr:acyltransferase [Actinotalea sp.]